MQIILASASPRRRELLADAGVAFEVIVSPAEEIHDASLPPEILCETNARLKAGAVAHDYPNAAIIGADTLVFIDDLPLGKPRDLAEAKEMLRRLSGRIHKVCTGVCVIAAGKTSCFHETTHVTFRSLNDETIDRYLSLCDPLDKAGAYGIQDHGDLIVESIDGSFDNVMGLPVRRLLEFLEPFHRPRTVVSTREFFPTKARPRDPTARPPTRSPADACDPRNAP
ncbi:MAG: Maf family protein [Verrucomicrobiota bacterium]